MEVQIATTPFGGRPMSLALVHGHMASHKIKQGRAIDKWALYKDLCIAKSVLGTNDRALAVLNALLSFYPDSELSEENNLVVFPSNKQLSLRAHGMPDATLRRHLASLVDAGLILRRDSPNGKRYAHKSKAGDIEEAFGLSLAPLLARADEIMLLADQVRTHAVMLKRTRERITLQRRDISKLIEVALEEEAAGNWSDLWLRFRAVVDALPRRATLSTLESFLNELTSIRTEIDKALQLLDKTLNMNGNHAQYERQHTESHSELIIDSVPALKTVTNKTKTITNIIQPSASYPISLVLKACPDIETYAISGIKNWRDMMTTTAQVSRFLNISSSAYEQALNVLGQENTAIVIACILQRSHIINSAGGYLRSLTDRARAGELSIGSMIMATVKTNSGDNKVSR